MAEDKEKKSLVLSDEDVGRIADKMIEHIQLQKHDFWIDPEAHYQDHLKMRAIAGSWDNASSIFFKAFLGLVVIGSVVLAMIGLSGKIGN